MALIAQPIAFGFAALVCAVSTGHAAPAEKPDVANILGTYECHTGTSVDVAVDREPQIRKSDAANPTMRITIASLDENAKPKMQSWDSRQKTWKETGPGFQLWVRRVEFKDVYWFINFEGVDRLSQPSAMLTNAPGASTRTASPSNKHVFAVTKLASFFASASIFACDKL
jgi:hypothetical protein